MFANSAMFLLGLSLVILGANAKVVKFIEPCAINDNKCVLASSIKALPFVLDGVNGIPPADPVTIESISEVIDEFKITFKNLTVTGFKKCTLNKVERTSKLEAKFEAECPVTAIGEYKMDGSLLGIYAKGDGPFKLFIENMKLAVVSTLKIITGEDEKQHYKIHKFDYEYDPLGEVKFNLGNLFGGDKKEAAPVNDFIENNGKIVLQTLGKPFINEIIKKEIQVLNSLFATLSIDEIELP